MAASRPLFATLGALAFLGVACSLPDYRYDDKAYAQAKAAGVGGADSAGGAAGNAGTSGKAGTTGGSSTGAAAGVAGMSGAGATAGGKGGAAGASGGTGTGGMSAIGGASPGGAGGSSGGMGGMSGTTGGSGGAVAPGGPCTGSDDCGGGQVCSSLDIASKTIKCQNGIPGGKDTGKDCSAGSECASALCGPWKTCSVMCKNDQQCGAGNFCAEIPYNNFAPNYPSECLRSCAKDADCVAAGTLCALMVDKSTKTIQFGCFQPEGAGKFGDPLDQTKGCESGIYTLDAPQTCSKACVNSMDCTAPLANCTPIMIKDSMGDTGDISICGI